MSKKTASIETASSEEAQETHFEDSIHESITLSSGNNSNLLQNLIQTQIVEQPLQILQTADGATQILNAETLQTLEGIVILAAPSGLEDTQNEDVSEKIWQVVPTSGNSGITHIIAVGQSETSSVTVTNEEENNSRDELDTDSSLSSDTLASMLISNPISNSKLPSNTPNWALKLRDCEMIGDSYRGWLASEPELDLILTFHKQQTQSFWGTRQSPSSQRQSTRLMWKSQYVPFDGIPFINSGSRAIVMECQYGPRRKGHPTKKQGDSKSEFKQTCPARIYIKKVTKYPEYAVDLNTDRKNLRTAMDRAFQDLKNRGLNGHGEDRWYVQLPTSAAHEYHDEKPHGKKNSIQYTESKSKPILETGQLQNRRMHPKLVEKIRDLVQRGENSVYEIRKKLRKYVEREMFDSLEQIPERHNLCYFPTVHDIQNHIFQALKDVENGHLQLLPSAALVDMGSEEENSSDQVCIENVTTSCTVPKIETQFLWPTTNLVAAEDNQKNSSSQTMTVTFTQPQEENGMISKLDTQLSSGSMQISTTLLPETAQLLSKLHPNMYSAGFIQLHDSNILPGVLLTPHITEMKSENSEVEKMEVDLNDFPSASVTPQTSELKTTNIEIKTENDNEENSSDKEASIIVTVGEGGEILHIQSQNS